LVVHGFFGKFKALGAILSQLQAVIEKVIQYASKVLKSEQERYCTTKRELLAATWSLETFRHYLQYVKYA
jgi:hypothetical protein